MKNTILHLLFVFCLNTVSAQFQSAELGISGLTCSACSKSVEMSLRKVSFVENITMNLERTEAKVIFKTGNPVEIEKLARAVMDAGFSLSYLNADFIFENLSVSNDFCFAYEKSTYQFLLSENKTLSGKTTLQFIGDKYLSKKDLGPWKGKMTTLCKSKDKKAGFYFITL